MQKNVYGFLCAATPFSRGPHVEPTPIERECLTEAKIYGFPKTTRSAMNLAYAYFRPGCSLERLNLEPDWRRSDHVDQFSVLIAYSYHFIDNLKKLHSLLHY